MNILVINSGSSSIKFSIFAADTAQPDGQPRPLLDGELSGIGNPGASLRTGRETTEVDAQDPARAIHLVLDRLAGPGLPAFDAVGYRVVHPGPGIDHHVRITDEVLAQLQAAVAFAPLHDPQAIELIRETMARFPALAHYACFDTIFHQTMPDDVSTYPIPEAIRAQGVRRFGFHGLSCESVVRQLGAAGIEAKRVVIAHLGSGCSLTAVREGRSVENTMGLTPTGGVVMGTRPGDLDPGLIFYLLRLPGASVASVEHMLNHDAGLKALSGSNDMRKLREGERAGDQSAGLPIRIFIASVRKAMAGLCAVHGADAIVFTGGIGEHDAETRMAVANCLWPDQPIVDEHRNQLQQPQESPVKISTDSSAIPVYVVPADEDSMIAVHVARLSASNE